MFEVKTSLSRLACEYNLWVKRKHHWTCACQCQTLLHVYAIFYPTLVNKFNFPVYSKFFKFLHNEFNRIKQYKSWHYGRILESNMSIIINGTPLFLNHGTVHIQFVLYLCLFFVHTYQHNMFFLKDSCSKPLLIRVIRVIRYTYTIQDKHTGTWRQTLI